MPVATSGRSATHVSQPGQSRAAVACADLARLPELLAIAGQRNGGEQEAKT